MSYQAHIDWEWGEFGNPARPECIFYVIKYGPPPTIRGNISAHECVANCITSARDGDRSSAVRWLMAGQCHSPDGQGEIERAGNAAVDYAVGRYGMQIIHAAEFVAGMAAKADAAKST